MAAKKYVVVVTYDPNIYDRDRVVDLFIDQFDHDGGGFRFVTGFRDEFFYSDGPIERSSFQQTVRNLRRRKGIEQVSVSVDDYCQTCDGDCLGEKSHEERK